MRLLVCGGRDFKDAPWLNAVLDHLRAKLYDRGLVLTAIIHGDARGADRLAKQWAESRGVPHRPFPAKWTKYGKAAGSIRNQQMLDEGKPDAVLAFDGGSGTQDMVDRARKAGLKVTQVTKPVAE